MNLTTDHFRYRFKLRHVVKPVILLAIIYLGYLATIREFPLYIGPLTFQLKYGNTHVRGKAVSKLDRASRQSDLHPRQINTLISAFKDKDPSYQSAATRVLIRLAHNASHPVLSCNEPAPSHPLIPLIYEPVFHALIDALNEGQLGSDSRSSIISCLQQCLAPKEVIPVFINVLKWDKNSVCRSEAAKALSEYGPAAKEALPALIVALEDKVVHFEAAQALTKIGPTAKAALPALRELQMHSDKSVVASAHYALRKLDPTNLSVEDAVASFIEKLKHGRVSADFVPALLKLGSKSKVSAVPLLIEGLGDEDGLVRVRMAETLWKLDRQLKVVMPVLIESLKDKNRSVRYCAADAIQQIAGGGRSQIFALQHRATIPNTGQVPPKLPDEVKAAVRPLIDTLNDEDRAVRREAVSALRFFHEESEIVIPALREAQKDPDRSVHKEATAVLKYIQR